MRSSDLDRVWEIPEQLAALERRVAALRLEQLELIGELDRLVPIGFPDAAREEVAVACRISDGEARKRLAAARALREPVTRAGTAGEPRLAATAAAMAAGEVSLEHAQAMAAATAELEVESARWVEATVLADTRARTPGQVAFRARKAALQVGAEQAERRAAAQSARELLAFEFEGRVCLSWSMPAVDAAVVAGRLDGLSARRGPGDVRPAAQRRADALYELVTGTEQAAASAGAPQLDVIVTHESLLDRMWREAGLAGADRQGGGWAGASIDGRSVFGAQLRQLGCDADVRVTLVNDGGCVLDQGRSSRVVSSRLRGLLSMRDQHCRFVGCATPARRCHAHHIWHWADGGPTDLANLIMLCDRHHHAVHDGGWTVELRPGGTATWTSPTGQTVTTPAELDVLALPPPAPGVDNDHLDGQWIRPGHEFFHGPPLTPEPSTSGTADEPTADAGAAVTLAAAGATPF